MTMLYIHGTSNRWEGLEFDYIIVEDDKVAEFLKKGYVKSPCDLKVEKVASSNKRVKKNELDQKTTN
jgi:hypothetical protein